jgi:hypothetical protein
MEVGYENHDPDLAYRRHGVGDQPRTHRAFNVLHNAFIQTRGGGRFADSSAAIVLARESDSPDALAALEQAGIRALAS